MLAPRARVSVAQTRALVSAVSTLATVSYPCFVPSPRQGGGGRQTMLFTEGEVGQMAAFAGGDVAVRYAKKTDVAVSAIVEPLHQQRDGPPRRHSTPRRSRERRGPSAPGCRARGEHRFVDAGKTEQHHAVNIAPGEHAEMLLHQRCRGELALHHNRIVTPAHKRRAAWSARQGFPTANRDG